MQNPKNTLRSNSAAKGAGLRSADATGVSWLSYFRALQLAPASRVAPIDKRSLALTSALAALFLGESVSWNSPSAAALMVAGALLTLPA